MEEWRKKLIQEAEEKAERAKKDVLQYAKTKSDKIDVTLDIKKQIIKTLREEPYLLFGNSDVYIRTDNHELVHDVAKTLGIELKRTAQADGFNFTGNYNGIQICVYGMKEIPHCKIVAKKVMQEVIEYETVCNQEEEK